MINGGQARFSHPGAILANSLLTLSRDGRIELAAPSSPGTKSLNNGREVINGGQARYGSANLRHLAFYFQ